jgi:hypothetical protein
MRHVTGDLVKCAHCGAWHDELYDSETGVYSYFCPALPGQLRVVNDIA